MKVHGVGEALGYGLAIAQCNKPPEVVTVTADALNDHGFEEEATQLRGVCVCVSVFLWFLFVLLQVLVNGTARPVGLA